MSVIHSERDILLCNGGSECGLCIFPFVTDVGSLFLSTTASHTWFTVFRLLVVTSLILTRTRLSPEAIIAAE